MDYQEFEPKAKGLTMMTSVNGKGYKQIDTTVHFLLDSSVAHSMLCN